MPEPSLAPSPAMYHPIACGKGAVALAPAPGATAVDALDWESDFDIAAMWGAKVVLTLCHPLELPDLLDSDKGLPPLAQAVLARRMGWALIPFPLEKEPHPVAQDAFREVASVWAPRVVAGDKIWIHDRDGDGRAARAVAWFLARSGMPLADVWKALPGWEPAGWEKAWVGTAVQKT